MKSKGMAAGAEQLPRALRPNASDRAAEGLLALTSAVDVISPGAGSLFGALVGRIIPDLRQERVAAYCAKLGRLLQEVRFVQATHAERLDALEQAFRDAALRLGPEQVALFEEGARASSRATAEERIERIAKMVAHGLSQDEQEAAYTREMLRLAEELSDADVIFLRRFDNVGGREGRPLTPSERELERVVSYGESLAMAPDARAALERQRVFVTFRRERLAGLGLLDKAQPPPHTVQQGGRLVLASAEAAFTLSGLGRLVLRHMGLESLDPRLRHVEQQGAAGADE